VDPVCHTLVGAAMGAGGLRRRTALAVPTLVLGANLPDIDALAYFGGPGADLAWRRGWTHGVLALVLLPLLLTGGMLLLDRGLRRLRNASLPSSVVPSQILLLSVLSILTHPLLDFLNTYGVRWLMPLSGRWFYGDTLFIVDPWLWLALGAGVFLSRRRRGAFKFEDESPRAARIALLAAGLYIVAMAGSSVAARSIARRELTARSSAPVGRIMVSPVLANPLARLVVAEQGDRYWTGKFRWWWRPHLQAASFESYPRTRPADPAVGIAAATPLGRRFLGWARFPAFEVDRVDATGSTVVHIFDVRYARRPGVRFGAVSISVSPPAASPP
jgi:inner membrane protein